ncbi:hypothetical protein AAL_00526 [Moelleriella libera RCEF 2490]|uniref:Uncharacterized protein n=1 Tax=Moelleriella libera RCEF 2490 TaxID=1081109 RepID=A0A166UXC4_9HYPO|nr:hypothetical protein AAL_00526 [Moelleriella libera RCEF 2490]
MFPTTLCLVLISTTLAAAAVQKRHHPALAPLETNALAAVTTVMPAKAGSTAPPSLSTTQSCDYAYCDEYGSKWCYVWGGITGFDISKGPIPGETRIGIGLCSGGPKTLAA